MVDINRRSVLAALAAGAAIGPELLFPKLALAFVASGLLWSAAVILPRHRGGQALGASLWPALHAGFHVVGWVQHGLPQGTALWSEVLGVVLVAAVALSLAILLLRSGASS